MAQIVIQQVAILMRGRNGYKMTKKRSMAMDVRDSVDTYTDVPCHPNYKVKNRIYKKNPKSKCNYLRIGDQMTKDFAENPLFEEKVERSERDGQDA